MTAKIVTVFNQKGGAGKTTVSLCLAGALGHRGHKVALVDLDGQGTAALSVGAATESNPFPATVFPLAVHPHPDREIRKFVDDYDFIVIDCPPAIQSAAPSVALLVSDLGLIPVVGSAGNFWAVKEAKNLARRAQVQNATLQVRTIANQTKNRTISKNVFEALGQDEEFPLCASSLGDRAAYPEAEATGMPVVAMSSSAREAKKEVNALVDEVLEIIGA